MRGLDTGIFLLWMIILHQGSCNYVDILWGQCYAFCLTRHEASQKDGDSKLNAVDTAIRMCSKDRQCKWCLFACDRPRENYANHEDCLNNCKIPRIQRHEAAFLACNDSCNFLARASQSKCGDCPAPSEMGGFRRACVEECSRDVDCDGMRKCCDNGCGKTCQKPVESDVFPSVPTNLEFKERKDGGMIIEWEGNKVGAIIKPIIYVLRWWCPYTQGVHHSISTKARAKLKGHPNGIHPGARCNFMVASINIHGSAGFSKKQVHRKRFVKPSPPLNLETIRNKLHDGKVDVTIQWQPPRHTDGLTVTKYLVHWSDGLPKAGPRYTRLRMHKKTVNAQTTTYTIQNLNPGIYYFVQVRAEVSWEGKSIRGEPASDYIETHSFPQPAGLDVEDRLPYASDSESNIYNISVGEPVFINSQLIARVTWSLHPGASIKKYILYWTVDVCDGEAKHRKTKDRIEQEATTHKREFQLYNLHSGCVYQVRIHTVNFFEDIGRGQSEYFRTPPCWETKGAGVEMICPPKVSPPLPPKDLSVRFKMTSNCICQAVISWGRPSDDNRKINQFSILWGQSRPPSSEHGVGSVLQSSTIVYNTAPYKIQVPGNDSRACMTYMDSDKHYTVQVISHIAKVKSLPAVLHLNTPADLPPCYGTGADMITDMKNETDFLGSIEKPDQEKPITPATAHESNNSPPFKISLLSLYLSSLLYLMLWKL